MFANDLSFGSVGTYQRLDGTAYMEVNPTDPLDNAVMKFNAGLTDTEA